MGYYKNIVRELVGLAPEIEFYVIASEKLLPIFDIAAPNLRYILLRHSNENMVRRVLSEHLILPGQLSRHGIDVLNTGNIAPFRVPCKLVATVKTMHAFTTPDALPLAKRLYRKYAGKRTAARADIVIANSQSNKVDIQKYFGVNDDRIRIVHEALDHELFRPTRNNMEAFDENEEDGIKRPFVVFVSSLWRYKNAEILIRAASIWRRSLPDLSVVFAGYHPDLLYLNELRALSSKLGVSDQVVFTGGLTQEKLLRLYRGAEAVVYPSVYETFGLPLLEAMAVGCPVLASNVSSLPEVGGEAARYFSPDQPEELAHLVEIMASDRIARQSQIELGFNRSAEFTWKRTARETLQAYEDAIDV